MQILQPPQLPRDTNGQSPDRARILPTLIHIPMRRGRSRLPVIDNLILPLGVSHEHEATAADSGMIHPDDADAERGGHHRVGSRAANLDDAGADAGAYRALAGDGAAGAVGMSR